MTDALELTGYPFAFELHNIDRIEKYERIGICQRVELNWGSYAAHLRNVERSLQDELIYDLGLLVPRTWLAGGLARKEQKPV